MAVIFISAVTKEFGRERSYLGAKLKTRDVQTHVQEDFTVGGGELLCKLDDYLRTCDAVVHFVGGMTGMIAEKRSVDALLRSCPNLPDRLRAISDIDDIIAGKTLLSYTHWEALIAYYYNKSLIVVAPSQEEAGLSNDEQRASQLAHLKRLEALKRPVEYRFSTQHDLTEEVLRGPVGEVLRRGDRVRKPNTLPMMSLGHLFKGREKAMAGIQTALEKHGGAAVTGRAIHGLGGVGKTRLAIEYAFAHRNRYSATLFVGAETPQLFRAGLAALTGALAFNLPEQHTANEDEQIAASLEWLENHPTWLMIIDNIDTEEARDAIKAYMPRLIGGHVLMTARLDSIGFLESLPLDILGDLPAKEFLNEKTAARRRILPDESEALETLVVELGGLPLALEQAAAYITEESISYAAYVDRWQKSRDEVLKVFDPDLMTSNHDIGLAATWTTSVSRLPENGRFLLNRLAFLAPEPIPLSLLDVPIEDAASDFSARDALKDLYKYSLATRPGREGEGFTVHRLVQDFARRALTEEEENQTLASTENWLSSSFVGNPEDVRGWPILESLESHVSMMFGLDRAAAIAPSMMSLMNRLAQYYRHKARFKQAESLYRRALAQIESGQEVEGGLHASLLSNLAEVLQVTNQVGEAERLIRRALEIDELNYGADHPEVAVDINNLAQLLKATNRLEEAEPLMRRVLTIDESAYGSDHPDVAIDLSNLAGLLQATDRLEEAEPLIRRALAIDEAFYGLDYPKVAIRLNNLALMLQATNRFEEAETLMRRALVIDEAAYGPHHPDVAIDINNLAILFKATNRLDEAEPLMRRVLAIDEETYGPDHPDVALDLNNLAGLLVAMNHFVEAEPLSLRAVKIFVAFGSATGHLHPHLQTALANHYGLLRRLGRSDSEIAAEFAELGVRLGDNPDAS